MTRVAIDGNFGSGVTFYLQKLQNEGYSVHGTLDDRTVPPGVLEHGVPPTPSPKGGVPPSLQDPIGDETARWQSKYQSNMKRYALGFQLQMHHELVHLPYDQDQLNIYERSPYTLQHVFGDFLYEEGFLETE